MTRLDLYIDLRNYKFLEQNFYCVHNQSNRFLIPDTFLFKFLSLSEVLLEM